MRAERSRSSSMPFGLCRAGNTIPRVSTLQEVSEILLRPYGDAVIHPEFCCDGIVAGRGVFYVNHCIFGCCRKSLTLHANIQLSAFVIAARRICRMTPRGEGASIWIFYPILPICRDKITALIKVRNVQRVLKGVYLAIVQPPNEVLCVQLAFFCYLCSDLQRLSTD